MGAHFRRKAPAVRRRTGKDFLQKVKLERRLEEVKEEGGDSRSATSFSRWLRSPPGFDSKGASSAPSSPMTSRRKGSCCSQSLH